MKTTLAFFVVLVAAASAIPRNRRDVKDAAQPTQLTELITQAQTNINNLGKQIQEQLNLPDQETVVNTIKTQSTNFAEGLKGVVTKATEEVECKFYFIV
ncbi:uncharacterized protein LOC117169123 [Belonocnema kinseyi]|uniref:uncharacterized protein LOC117169123 n=1 Tax=Belonocnema kinseyi TaxID=2817044 RepID=UPI00143D12AC|nr:uncharacterized protein LOC117169123 [Belonocnema kinseyi]